MGRARVLHPKFFLNEELDRLEVETGLPVMLVYAGLWCQADREGRFEWKPGVLKLAILPWRQVDFEAVLEALERADFVRSWWHDGRRYGWIPQFLRWQKPHPREARSQIPAPPKELASLRRAQGVPKASPRQEVPANTVADNNNGDGPPQEAGEGHAQGEPKASPRREMSAGLEDYRVSSDLGSSSDWRSPSGLRTAEDSNGLSSLREARPVGPAHPEPEPVPDEEFERRRAAVRETLQAQREGRP